MSSELEVALDAVREAGAMLREVERSRRQLGHKNSKDEHQDSRKSFVTEMDYLCDKRLKERLHAAFPHYGLLTEESTPTNLSAERVWVVDPLDGTLSYGHGLDSYVTAVGLLHGRDVVLGAVYQPEKDELFYAERGCGAYLNGEPIEVSGQTEVGDSLISMGHRIFRRPEYHRAKTELVREMKRLRVSESCSQELCYLAAGRIDGFIRTFQPTYDFVMGKVIVEEAGGVLRDFHNDAVAIHLNCERYANLVAGHEQLVTRLCSYLTP
jgi:myo-inositol-1(or 4)-monophosphatase